MPIDPQPRRRRRLQFLAINKHSATKNESITILHQAKHDNTSTASTPYSAHDSLLRTGKASDLASRQIIAEIPCAVQSAK
jgi:hypothetical protein